MPALSEVFSSNDAKPNDKSRENQDGNHVHFVSVEQSTNAKYPCFTPTNPDDNLLQMMEQNYFFTREIGSGG